MTESTIPLIEWLKCRKLLNRHWTDEQIIKAMKELRWTVRTLTDETGFRKVPEWYEPHEVLKTGYRFTTKESHPCAHEYQKEIQVTGVLARIPSQYQGLKHGSLIQQLLFTQFPFMKEPIFTYQVAQKIVFDPERYTRLSEIPESMQNMTIKELIKQEHVQNICETRSRWKFYGADHLRDNQDYQFYLECETEETENTYDQKNQVYREKGRGTLYINLKDWFNSNIEQFIEKSQYDKNLLRKSPQFIALKQYFGEAHG